MKNNLKKKVMLAVLAGGMLCANGAFATVAPYWYGTTGNEWTASSPNVAINDLTLTVEDGQMVYSIALANVERICGGYTNTDGDEVKNNSITFNTTQASTIKATIYGGYSENNCNVTNNSVIIKDGDFSNSIYGGYSMSGNVTNNSVTINGGTFDDKIDGGYSTNGNATGNSVTINGGTFNDDCDEIRGGYAFGTGEAKNNSITLNTANTTTIKATIYGGKSNTSGNATGNSVTIKGGVFTNDIYGGKSSSGNATGNSVTINGGTLSKNIYGGSGKDVSGNMVTINDGTFNGTGYIYGGYSMSGTVGGDTPELGNKVIIEKGTFDKNIYGGRGVHASGNEVIINGGTINKSVYGGEAIGGTGIVCKAIGNIVTINGGTFANGNALYGGYFSSSKSGISTGNILNLKKKLENNSISVKFASVQNFQVFNFTLPTDIKAGDVMLSAHELIVNNSNAAEVNVYAANDVKLSKDAVITLIDVYEGEKSDPGTVNGTFEGKDVLGGAGKIELVNNDLILTMLQDFVGPYSPKEDSGGGADQQKAPLEGMTAAAAMVNVTADLVSGDGMDSMLAETADTEINTFGAVSAGRSKFKTGSHVDVDGWGVVVGAGKTKEWTNGSATTMGIFLEYGKGDFDTYNGVFHGDGDTKNHGVGVMARHKATNNNYYEGNIRYGRQETSWGQSEIGGYETDSRYYGVMVGMGHIIQLGKNELDVYGRYSYGHVGACNAKVGDNDYRFDSVKSHRVRVGGKYNFVRANSKAKPFVGVAWEHEFNGESKATIAGVGQAPAPSLKGNTGIIQAGCDWDLGEKWSVGASANAYVGKRKGWDGMLRAFYTF